MAPMGDDGEAGTLSRTVAIEGPLGLHARPAAGLVKIASGFDAEITVECKGMTVSGRSIMGLMMLAASEGTELTIRAAGPEAEKALAALTAYVESGFE